MKFLYERLRDIADKLETLEHEFLDADENSLHEGIIAEKLNDIENYTEKIENVIGM